MKIEIDFSKPDDLRKLKRELEMALSTIDGALLAISKNHSESSHPILPLSTGLDSAQPPISSGGGASMTQDILHNLLIKDAMLALPNEFTMRDVLEHQSISTVAPSRIRREIAEIVGVGWLIVTVPGQGRRPTCFRKAYGGIQR